MSAITDPKPPLAYWLQALVDTDFASPPGQSQTYTYSFAVAGSTGTTGPREVYFSAADQVRIRAALALWSANTGLKFVETTSYADAHVQFKYGDLSGKDADGETTLTSGGQATVTVDQKAAGGALVADVGWMGLLLHEIGHALGLKHPGDYFNGAEAGPYLSAAEDLRNYTQLAYPYDPVNWQASYDSTLRPFDTAAAQYLFGVDPALNAGNTTWRYTSLTGMNNLIGDGSGIDTLDAGDVRPSVSLGGGTGYDMTVDLREGGRIYAGAAKELITAAGQVSINYGTVIENAIGSSGRNLLIGNAAANNLRGGPLADTLVGGGGNDVLDGADGLDTAMYGSTRSAYTLAKTSDGWRVTAGVSPYDTDTLVSVERLSFVDRSVALDVDGAAGTVARILGAVFGKAAVGNADYAGIGLYYMDQGMSLDKLVQMALDARVNPLASSATLVDVLYTNVVGSHPSAGDLAYFAGLLDQHVYTRAGLAMMAAQTDLNATQIDLAGIVQHGLDYIPYAG